jgi:hypothetical protein
MGFAHFLWSEGETSPLKIAFDFDLSFDFDLDFKDLKTCKTPINYFFELSATILLYYVYGTLCF